jgi:hypothetical protein
MSQAMSVKELLTHLSQVFYPAAFVEQNIQSLKAVIPPNRQVLISAMPKTGSTLLFRALATAINRPINLATYSTDGNENELYFPALAQAALLKPGLCRLHMRATRPNLALLKAFNITPIIQIRNLLDILVSQRDHILRDLFSTTGAVTAHQADPLHAHFRALDHEQQFDLLIDQRVPWLLEFYRSWAEAEMRGDVKLHWLDYSELNADKVGSIVRAAAFLGMDCSPQRVEAALALLPPKKTRFNQAVEGRGEQALSDAQKERVIAMARHYPWIDFTPLGLPVAPSTTAPGIAPGIAPGVAPGVAPGIIAAMASDSAPDSAAAA